MPVQTESRAVAVALAHVEASSNHDFDTARSHLAPDVTVAVTTTTPGTRATNLAGIEKYMEGLIEFARAVVPGSLRVDASIGDERNALVMVTMPAAFGPGAPPVITNPPPDRRRQFNAPGADLRFPAR